MEWAQNRQNPQTPPEPDRKASGKQCEEQVQFVALRLAGGTSRRSPPCSRRHALVTVHASFLVDEVVRQVYVRPASLSARGADVLVSVVTTRPTVSLRGMLTSLTPKPILYDCKNHKKTMRS